MGLTLPRRKKRHWLLSIAYRVHRLMPLSGGRKLDLYLDLAWIATRLAHETSFGVFDEHNHPCRRINFLLDGIVRGERVLDLGCAQGVIANMLAQRGAEVVGVDHDAKQIEQAKARYPDVQFVTGDARDYLRDADRFDVLVLSHILEHLDDPRQFMREIATHFERIYIEVPDFEASYLNEMRLARSRALNYQDNDHVSEFDRRELKQLLCDADVTVTAECYSHGVMRFWCEPLTPLHQLKGPS